MDFAHSKRSKTIAELKPFKIKSANNYRTPHRFNKDPTIPDGTFAGEQTDSLMPRLSLAYAKNITKNN